MIKRYKSSISFRGALLGTVAAAAIAGYSLGQFGVAPVTNSYADAVKVEAPAVFSFGDVVEAVSPAVVSVRVEAEVEPADFHNNFRFDRRGGDGQQFDFERFFRNLPGYRDFFRDGPNRGPRFGMSQGSGFFVSEDGYVVTNNHVVENGNRYTVILSDGSELEASLIGSDTRTDLAVLKVDADREFTYVEFGDDRPRIGDWVVAVGNPFGLGGTVTAGIVSAHGREIGANRYEDFIQIDAAVNKGNSGGPAFNLKGEVIGVNTAIFSPSGGNVGIAFAIPAALAKEVVSDLIDDGQVVRGWLGVQIQPVTEDIAESLGLEQASGAIVTSPQEGGPAEDAGIQPGDVILSVDGKAIKGPRELAREIAAYEPDSDVTLNIWRDGSARDISVRLGELQAAESVKPGKAKPSRFSELGIIVNPTPDGLVVREVKPGSDAAEKGIRQGDIIVSVNGERVTTPRELRENLEAIGKMGRKSALLQVEREQNTVFIPVPVGRG